MDAVLISLTGSALSPKLLVFNYFNLCMDVFMNLIFVLCIFTDICHYKFHSLYLEPHCLAQYLCIINICWLIDWLVGPEVTIDFPCSDHSESVWLEMTFHFYMLTNFIVVIYW